MLSAAIDAVCRDNATQLSFKFDYGLSVSMTDEEANTLLHHGKPHTNSFVAVRTCDSSAS